MYKRSLMFTALALGIMCRCAPALANDDPNDGHLGSGIHDVTDPELADMRGRYVVGNNTVVYFGVEMITTMQTNTGQTLQGTLTVGMNFSKNPNAPQVTFVPTVTITTPDSPLPTASTIQSNVSHSVQSGGIANVGGFIQSVQIAGDNNAAANVTRLNIQSGGSDPDVSTASNESTTITPTSSNTNSTNSSNANGSSTSSVASVVTTGSMANTNSSTSTTSPDTGNGSSNTNNGSSGNNSSNTTPGWTTNSGVATSTGRTATVGGSSVSSTYSNNGADVTATVDGQGSASQFMHPGSLGQEIQLATDNAVVTNQMIVNLVTQQMSGTEQLAHTLAQSLNLSHFTGH
jgi:hypothetical protein